MYNHLKDKRDKDKIRHKLPRRREEQKMANDTQNAVQVIRADEDTWRIENGMVRLFLLRGSEKAMLIDTGMTVRGAREMAEKLAERPVLLLNTHADRDHVGANSDFDAFHMHPADEKQYRQEGGSGELVPLADGQEIDLGGRKLRIIHLPGHTPGSVAVLDVSRRVLISGDPIQEHGRIFMFGEQRNLRAYAESLERLEGMTGAFDEIWPSHADLPLSPACIPKLREGALRILEGKAEGHEADFHGMKITVYDLGFTAFLCNA